MKQASFLIARRVDCLRTKVVFFLISKVMRDFCRFRKKPETILQFSSPPACTVKVELL